MDGVYTVASSSVSSLYGNVAKCMVELIKSKFPVNFFNYENVSTEVAFRNIRRQFGSNTNTEIAKRKRPFLIITPEYQEPDQDGFLQNIPLTRNEMDTTSGLNPRYLFQILSDQENGYNLKFKLNRDHIDYNVRLAFDTPLQQLDVFKALQNVITWDFWTYERAALEAVIPKTLINYMSKLSKMDIIKTPEYKAMYIRHLNSVASYPITYKLRNASSTDEYFMYYTHNLCVRFSDLNMSSSNMKGMLNESYEIEFKVSVEFNLPGLYALETDRERLQYLQVGITSKSEYMKDSDAEYVPLFTLSNVFNKYPSSIDGLRLYTAFIFNTDKGESVKDTLSITEIFEQEIQNAIFIQLNHGVSPETLSKIIILKNSKELIEGEDYEIIWSKLAIQINKPDENATYRCLVYMNMASINEILSNARIDGPYDQHALKDNAVDYSPVMKTGIMEVSENPEDGEINIEVPDGVQRVVTNAQRAHGTLDGPHDLPLDPMIGGVITGVPTPRFDHHTLHQYQPQPQEDVQAPFTEDSSIVPIGHTLEHQCDLHPLDVPYIETDDFSKKDDPDEEEKIVKKYHSSIFDNGDNIITEEEKKKKYTSSADPNRKNPVIKFHDNPNPSTLNSLDVWAKIISHAMIYNFATKLAMEDDKNYKIESEVAPE